MTDRTGIERRSVLRGMLGGAGYFTLGGVGFGALAACSDGSAASSGDAGPIRIGVLTDMTGDFGVVGKANKAVADFTVDEINQEGGVLGRTVEIVLADSATDPAVGATVARRLVERDKVAMVFGGVASSMREAVKGIIAERGKTLYMYPTAYEGGACNDSVWCVGAVPNQQVDPLLEAVLDTPGKTVFLVGSDYVFPHTVIERAAKKISELGGTVVGEEYIPLDATEATTVVTQILNSKADVLFDVTVYPVQISMIKSVVEGGFKGVIASPTYDELTMADLGPAGTGLVTVQDCFQTVPDAFTQTKIAEYSEKYPDQPFAAALGSSAWYRGLKLWAAAVEKAGSLDLDKVNAAMDDIHLDDLIGGPAGFVPGTKHCALPMYSARFDAQGQAEIFDSNPAVEPLECGGA